MLPLFWIRISADVQILGGVFESPAKNFPGTFLSDVGTYRLLNQATPTWKD